MSTYTTQPISSEYSKTSRSDELPADPMEVRLKRADAGVAQGEEVRQNDFYPIYHIAPRSGWMNDPNGLCFHNGDYHVFYQHHPFDSEWGPMHWGHAISKDLVHWQHLPVALAPGDAYDRDGCFSGSAVSYKGKLYLFYTGHRWLGKDKANAPVCQVQCLAVSEDGVHFDKKGAVLAPPSGYQHFRDPKVWLGSDNRWWMVVGARDTAKDCGQTLLFTATDPAVWANDDFAILGITGDRNTFMWECPDFFPLTPLASNPASPTTGNGAQRMMAASSSSTSSMLRPHAVSSTQPSSPTSAGTTSHFLVISPQGMQPEGYQYRNLFQTGYLRGRWAPFSPFRVEGAFVELDLGHDFYAAQTLEAPDGRRILLAWMDMWESPMPSREHGWSGALTIPRELAMCGRTGRLLVTPARELLALRRDGREIEATELEENTDYPLVEVCTAYEVEVTLNVERSTAEKYGLWLGSGAEIYVDAQSERLVVNRHYPEYMLSGNRSCPLPDGTELRLRVFFDRSSMEVFVNDGEACFSTRIYPNANDRALRLFSINGTTEVVGGAVWQLDSNVMSSPQ